MKIFRVKYLILALCALMAVSPHAFAHKKANETAPSTEKKMSGHFSLTDQNGKAVTDKDYKGKWRLVFFGFTYCPEVCPVTTAKISEVMKYLGNDAALIQPLFISVDSERDTPERLREYLKDYDARIIGLTGTEDQIKEAAKNFGAFYQRTETPGSSEGVSYDHSSYTYLISPKGEIVSFYRYKETAGAVTAAVDKTIKQKK